MVVSYSKLLVFRLSKVNAIKIKYRWFFSRTKK
jgi:hypothetical protein